MNVSAPFILRPIATTLLMVGLGAIGLMAYALLSIAGVPQVDIPTIQVTAQLPGASAETMATSVATPLERQLALISGVASLSSTSSLGQTSITVEFDLGRSVDGAALDVQSAINAAGGQLPKNLPNPPTYEKINPADALLMSIAVTSNDLPISKVDEYVENYVALQISRMTGVGLVDFHGEQKPAIRVQVNPREVAALGLSLEDIRAALASSTVNSPKGTFDGPRQSQTLDATDQLFDAASFNAVIIAYHNGAPVHVGDIGKAVDGVEDVRQAAWLGKQRAVTIDVHKQPGYNVNETVRLAGTTAFAAALDQDAGPWRPHPDHPRIGVGGAGDDGDQHRPSRTGGFSVPARCGGNAHPERHHPGFPAVHLRRHVSRRLHPGQRVADGADHRRRVYYR